MDTEKKTLVTTLSTYVTGENRKDFIVLWLRRYSTDSSGQGPKIIIIMCSNINTFTHIQFNEIQSLTGNASYKIKPHHIFEVIYSEDAEKKFGQLESLHGKDPCLSWN